MSRPALQGAGGTPPLFEHAPLAHAPGRARRPWSWPGSRPSGCTSSSGAPEETRPSPGELADRTGRGQAETAGVPRTRTGGAVPWPLPPPGPWPLPPPGPCPRPRPSRALCPRPARALCPRPSRALCPPRPVPCCRPISTYSTQGLDGGRWSDLLARDNRPLPVTGRVVARGASPSMLSLSSVMGTSVSHETCLMEQLEKRDSFPGPRPRKPDLEMPGTLGRQRPWEFLPGSATAAASCPVSPKWPTAVHPANNLAVAGSPPGVALHTHKRGCARAVLGKQWNLRGS